MALDNILALFLLPLFGALSDRTKIGRRMPFILGTACAAVLMNLLPVLDNRLRRSLTGKLAPVSPPCCACCSWRWAMLHLPPARRRPQAGRDAQPPALTRERHHQPHGRRRRHPLSRRRGGDVPEHQDRAPASIDHQLLFPRRFAVMLVSVAVLFLTVKEPKLAAETRARGAAASRVDLTEDDGSGNAAA